MWLLQVEAALLCYEGFNYPAGDSIVGKTGGSGFSAGWILNGGGGVSTNLANSLSYRDVAGNTLVTSGGSLFLQGATVDSPSSLAAQPSRTFSFARGTNAGATDGVPTWFSFLAVRQGPVTNATAFNPTGNPYPRSAGVSLYNTSAEKLGTATPLRPMVLYQMSFRFFLKALIPNLLQFLSAKPI